MMEPLLFAPLATPAPRLKPFMAAWGLELFLIAALVSFNALFPKALPAVTHYVAMDIIAPMTPAPVPHTPQVRMHIMPSLVPPPSLHVLTAPRRQEQYVEEVPAPVIVAKNKMPEMENIPAPKPIYNNFGNTGSSAKQTTTQPAIRVQTGGFGDPNGVAPDPNAHGRTTIAAFGSFDLPQGAGHGNGLGGKIPGVTASTGFGNGTATGNGRRTSIPTTVTESNFDKHEVESKEPTKVAEAPTTPAQIISKPTPQYTEEGRKLRIQGVVRVQVVLTANGKVQVLQVLSGLGHGLDEQAVRAVKLIEFKPAQRSGQSTDSTVVLAILFQLVS